MNKILSWVHLTIHFYKFKILIFLLVLLGIINETTEQMVHYHRTGQLDYLSVIFLIVMFYFVLDYLLNRYRGRYIAAGFCVVVLELPAIEGLALDLAVKGIKVTLANPYWYTLDIIYIVDILIATAAWFLIINLKEQNWF